jgi:hypothetical protein
MARPATQTAALLRRAQTCAAAAITGIDSEFCFNIARPRPLTAGERDVANWLLPEGLEAAWAQRSALHSHFTPISQVP